ncbi:MAG: BolA family protein [Pseudomonadota bacterium]
MRQQLIEKALQNMLKPSKLTVRDDSARHAGHAGAQPGGETHYNVTIVSDAFNGLSRLARHRLIHDALKNEFKSGLHALQIEARTAAETGENT